MGGFNPHPLCKGTLAPLHCAKVHIPTCTRAKVPLGLHCAEHDTAKEEKYTKKGGKMEENGGEKKGKTRDDF